jgi:hypothetical protein
MKLCRQYLSERGISEATTKFYGLELDDQIYSKKIKDRLGLKFPKGYNEVLWFPVYDAPGNIVAWIARPLPTMANQPKFVCPLGSSGVPFVPRNVYNLAFGKPVIVSEGPVKTLACIQAGVDAIGINGVWGAAIKNANGLYVIRADLQSSLDWRGRKVYLAFDTDCQINPDVRHALFRLFFVLLGSGAEIFQLTNWQHTQGKGIDDFLVNQVQSNGQCHPADVLKALMAGAKPFIDIVQPTAFDLGLVFTELQKVRIPAVLREQIIRPLAKNLGVTVDELRKLGPVQQKADFIDPDPWPSAVAGDVLLHDLAALVNKHTVVEEYCKVAVPLWNVLSFLIDIVDIMPILVITSPERRCGKTRLLGLLAKLVRRPMPGVLLTPATVFRSIEKSHPTLLIDEADGLLKDSKGNDNVELRSLINAGHTRDFAFVPRCVGESYEVQNFSAWAPKVIALIGRMPDSMMDRSIPIQMRRKTVAETVARLRETPQAVFDELRSKIVRWVQDNEQQISQHVPVLPTGINDRAADCWLPLLAIADIAGGDWPDLARKAAVALSADSDDDDTFTTKLLRALKQDFIDQGETGPDGFQITTDICDHLNQDNEAPWANFRNGLTPETLARNLAEYKVKSERIMHGGNRVRGFYWQKLSPIFDRYL